MANWSKQFKQIDTINSGQEYTLNDYVTLDMVNAPLNNTQYLYDVLYTTNTGLIAQVNTNTNNIATNTANITSVTNNLNNLKDNTLGTIRSRITNSGNYVSIFSYNSSGSEPEGDLMVEPDNVGIKFYYGPDSENLASFKFLPNGSMQVSQDGVNYVTFSYDRFKQKYIHNIRFYNTGDGSFLALTILSTQSTPIDRYSQFQQLLIDYIGASYKRITASGSFLEGDTIRVINAVDLDSNNNIRVFSDKAYSDLLTTIVSSSGRQVEDTVIPL